jgi:hypothetical protein
LDMTTETTTEDINLGPVTFEEMVVGSYEALKMVFAASVAQLTTTDIGAARSLYEQMCTDIDLQRARFIEAMRLDIADVVEAEVEAEATDADGFEYEAVIE